MFAKIFGNVSKESILWQKIIHRFTIFLTSRKWSKKRGTAVPRNSKYKLTKH
jgi:hypothetical protein